MTTTQFGGEGEEHVWLRWWNGEAESWHEAAWQKNVELGHSDETVGQFHEKPADGTVRVDLWRFDVPASATKPGDNFYVIQLKNQLADGTVEYYLLREPDVDLNGRNPLGQAWTATAANYFGRDWKVTIVD
jgi:hypothetical protein